MRRHAAVASANRDVNVQQMLAPLPIAAHNTVRVESPRHADTSADALRMSKILSVASGERMCSNLHACCSISVSLSIASESVNNLSAKR